MSIRKFSQGALGEMGQCLDCVDEKDVSRLIDLLVRSRRIAIYGCGREGLMMRALCMRLYHLGLDAHMVGDMTTPPVGDGDLLLASAGPGYLSTVDALIGVARGAGASIACITAEAGSPVTKTSDHALILPAQTMASDESDPVSILPMGSLFELVQIVLFEYLVEVLKERLGETSQSMRARHTNLE